MSKSTVRENGFSVTSRIEASPGTLYKAWTEKADMERGRLKRSSSLRLQASLAASPWQSVMCINSGEC